MKELFFARCATWHKMDDTQITVHDSFSPRAPRVITMDAWPQLVFLAADGQHTVGQLIAHLSREYESGPPAELEDQVVAVVQNLVDEGIVRVSASPVSLPPYFAEDHFAATPEERARQMRADGLIK
jgi:hypothetical protein